MKKICLFKKIVSFVTLTVLVLSLSLPLFSCTDGSSELPKFNFGDSVLSKEEIQNNINKDKEKNADRNDYVTEYLYEWGFPAFKTEKLAWAEQLFDRYYNMKSGLPGTLEHSVLTAEHFLENYYDDIDRTDITAVTDAVITSYVEVIGDPYSVYRTPVESEDYDADLSGEFGGIGVTVEYNHQEKTVMVSATHIGGPAEAAGIAVGDYIIGVDGKTIDELGYDSLVDHIRGKIGTSVTVKVKRGDKELEFTMERALVKEQSVTYSLDENKIGYIRVTQFIKVTFPQFREAMDYMKENGAKGIIFDMRSNPGGLVDSIVDMASYLLPTGKTVISYEYKNLPTVVLKTEDDKKENGETFDSVLDLPVVVLCNEYSASAAEIFTSVIRDYRDEGLFNATIVGTTTYKKGIMQGSFLYNPDGSQVTITVAYYNPPSGVNYHGIGVEPDVYVELPELKEGETSVEDTQLKAGIEELNKLINANNILQ